MLVTTNEGNPNALKLIVATKLAQEAVSVRILKPSGESINLFLFAPSRLDSHKFLTKGKY